jgi:hypothetical protein
VAREDAGRGLDELAFFRAIHEKNVRALLIGRRALVLLGPGVDVQRPTIDGLILTKRFADRPKDLEDIRMLRMLRSEGTI